MARLHPALLSRDWRSLPSMRMPGAEMECLNEATAFVQRHQLNPLLRKPCPYAQQGARVNSLREFFQDGNILHRSADLVVNQRQTAQFIIHFSLWGPARLQSTDPRVPRN